MHGPLRVKVSAAQDRLRFLEEALQRVDVFEQRAATAAGRRSGSRREARARWCKLHGSKPALYLRCLIRARRMHADACDAFDVLSLGRPFECPTQLASFPFPFCPPPPSLSIPNPIPCPGPYPRFQRKSSFCGLLNHSHGNRAAHHKDNRQQQYEQEEEQEAEEEIQEAATEERV